jgi:hypothetical protein
MKQTIELHKRWKANPSKGEVFTPSELIREMLDKIPTSVWENPESMFLDPCMGKGTFLIEIVTRLINIYGYSKEDAVSRVYGYDTCIKYVNHLKRGGLTNIFHKDFLNDEINMKFDVVIGNPPYQEKVGESNTEPIWNKFVEKSFQLVNINGYVSLIHPSGWRSNKGRFHYIKELILSKNPIFLKLHDFNEGQRVFGVGTNFDYYFVQNAVYSGNTTVVDVSKNIINYDLRKLPFIPNGLVEIFNKIVAKDTDEKVVLISSESKYAHRKSWMSKTQDNEYQHPCVYTITQKDGMKFYYSSLNDKGHFGIPKVIWSNGLGTYPIIDEDGQYGLMEYSFGISDDISNLENIKIALQSKRFLELMGYVKYTNNKYDSKIISTFKKDFWKEFVDE